jgi:hypothetical protein
LNAVNLFKSCISQNQKNHVDLDLTIVFSLWCVRLWILNNTRWILLLKNISYNLFIPSLDQLLVSYGYDEFGLLLLKKKDSLPTFMILSHPPPPNILIFLLNKNIGTRFLKFFLFKLKKKENWKTHLNVLIWCVKVSREQFHHTI